MHSTEPTAGANAPQPGWYPDPWQVAPTRWWDGIAWTGFTKAAAPAPVAPVAPAGPVDPRYAYSAIAHAPVHPERARNTGEVLPAARDDIHGGGIAVLGFFGAVALSLLLPALIVGGGVQRFTIPVIIVGQFGLWAGLCMAAWIVAHRRPGGTLADLGLRWPTSNEVGLGIGLGIGGLMVASRVTYVLQHAFPDNGGGSHIYVTGVPTYSLIFVTILLACVGAPIVEELFFRGLVQPVLARNLGTNPAIVAQAMLFGAAHYQFGMTFNQAAVKCGTIFVIGLFLGWLRATTGRLGAGMVAHATNNGIVTFLSLLTLINH